MLNVENLDLYYGASQALKSVAFEAEVGKVTTVLGRNGVGKTSLMKAVVGQQSIQSGTVIFENGDITSAPAHVRAAKGIAYVPQGREIFPLLTVEENLKTGFSSLPRSLRHIQDEIFELFPVLKDMLSRRGGDLSGGQQQQLAIARALVTRPRLLVLDEPTEGIQPSIIKDIERVIRLLANRGDMAILLVEQYFEFAHALADYIVVMDRGEVVMKGHKEDLIEEDVRRHLTV
ncbi:MAG: urea ABC transporter ATP-binding subunit UrtE [Methylocystaceae bacterium]|jgi:urea transport system ATP-binding protein|nr:urea ABC transporter ATP-binding subunit UrtE [Methylocystaceae bacterium]